MTDRPSDPNLGLEDGELSEAEALELEAALRGAGGDDALAAHDRAWAKALAAATTTEAAEPEATAAELAAMARGDDAAFLEALRAAEAPKPLDAARHELLVARALPRRTVLPRRALWAGSGLALAAAVLLAVQLGGSGEAPTPQVALATPAELSRSTESIAARTAPADTSARVDRIAQARAGDYRKNRFRGWGAK